MSTSVSIRAFGVLMRWSAASQSSRPRPTEPTPDPFAYLAVLALMVTGTAVSIGMP